MMLLNELQLGMTLFFDTKNDPERKGTVDQTPDNTAHFGVDLSFLPLV